MDCREVRERLSDLEDGCLPGTVADGVRGHLEECAGCAAVARSLDAVRAGLRRLPPVPAPPELLERVRESIAREAASREGAPGNGAAAEAPMRPAGSRWKIPLETAAALLLLASVYWYWAGSAPTTALPPAASVSSPVETAAPGPKPVETTSPARDLAASPPQAPPVQVASAPSESPSGLPSPPAEAARANRSEGRSIATLPEGTPDPKVRVYSLADLPAVPVLRASTRFARIQQAAPAESPSAESPSPEAEAASQPEAQAADTRTSRLRPPVPYGREVSVEVAPEDREEAVERIAQAARRLGGMVEGSERALPEGTVSVRVLLPERTAQAFLEELWRNGKMSPEGMPSRSILPAGPTPGTVAYTVHLHAR